MFLVAIGWLLPSHRLSWRKVILHLDQNNSSLSSVRVFFVCLFVCFTGAHPYSLCVPLSLNWHSKVPSGVLGAFSSHNMREKVELRMGWGVLWVDAYAILVRKAYLKKVPQGNPTLDYSDLLAWSTEASAACSAHQHGSKMLHSWLCRGRKQKEWGVLGSWF